MKKIEKIIIWIIILVVLVILSLYIFKLKTGELNNETTKICCKNNCFYVEIADNYEKRKLWLMYRKKLDNNKWMLFIFENSWKHSFRMKNTLIPLAWIRIDSNLKVIDIKLMEPCNSQECPSYTPRDKAKYVLEINQELIKENQAISIWDICMISSNNN